LEKIVLPAIFSFTISRCQRKRIHTHRIHRMKPEFFRKACKLSGKPEALQERGCID
jgi:hypothetical protein